MDGPNDIFLSLRMESDAIEWQGVQLRSVEGRETISQPFALEVTLVVDTSYGVSVEKLMDEPATLVFERGDREVRRFHGVVAEVRDLFDIESGFRSYRLLFVPRLWRLSLTHTLEIYMDKSIPDIIREVLERSGMVEAKGEDGEGDFEFRLARDYEAREFVVQFQESDLAFVNRWTEFCGVSYFIEHKNGRDVVVFTDSNLGFQALEGADTEARFNQGGHKSGVFDLQISTRSIPARYTVRDYNYRNPSLYLQAYWETTAGRGGEVVEYGAHFRTPEEGLAIAQVRAEEKLCRQRSIHGQSDVQTLSAGRIVTVTDLPGSDVSLLVHEITHVAQQPVYGRGDMQERMYRNDFVGYFSDLPYRPERLTPKAVVHGMLNGVVSNDGAEDGGGGGEGEDDRPYAKGDDQGRYRVRFLFDTKDEHGRLASRAIRMTQPHSGAGYGMHFPLRVGTEVVIAFVNGDPDRPFIAGTIPNPQTPSPVASDNHKRNVIRTGGGNEINIDDETGTERIKLWSPNSASTFQLGAPNAPEMGAALTTAGSASSVATTGIGSITTLGTTIDAFRSHKEGNVISSIAKEPDAPTKGLLLVTGVQFATLILKAIDGVWSATKSVLSLHQNEIKRDADEADLAEKDAQSAMEQALQDIWAYWESPLKSEGQVDLSSQLAVDMGDDRDDPNGIWQRHYNLMKQRGYRSSSVNAATNAGNLGNAGTQQMYDQRQQDQQSSIDGLERSFAQTYLDDIDALLNELAGSNASTSSYGSSAYSPTTDRRDGTHLVGGHEFAPAAVPDAPAGQMSDSRQGKNGLDAAHMGIAPATGAQTSSLTEAQLQADRKEVYDQLVELREKILRYLELMETYNDKATDAENAAIELAEWDHKYSNKGEGGQATSIIDLSTAGLITALGVIPALYSGYLAAKSWAMKAKSETKNDYQQRKMRKQYTAIKPRRLENPVPASGVPFSGAKKPAFRYPNLKKGKVDGGSWADPQHVIGCDGGGTAIYGDKHLFAWGQEVFIHGRQPIPLDGDGKLTSESGPAKGRVSILGEEFVSVSAEKIVELTSVHDTVVTSKLICAHGDERFQVVTGAPRPKRAATAPTRPPKKPAKGGISMLAKKEDVIVEAEDGAIDLTAAKTATFQIKGGVQVVIDDKKNVKIALPQNGPTIEMKPSEIAITMDPQNSITMKSGGIDMKCAKLSVNATGQIALKGATISLN